MITAKRYSLDTNILSALMKSNVTVKERLEEEIEAGSDITINAIAYYEIKRGLEAVQNPQKMRIFENICQTLGIVFLDDKVILDKAATVWAFLKKKGQLLKDADILIASSAMIKGYIVVSDDSDFERIPGVQQENWL